MKIHYLLLAVFLFIFISCENNQVTIDPDTYALYIKKGSELSARAQSALLTNVSAAMKEGGSLYAIEFCNLQASVITDSLSRDCDCTIARVSALNRNRRNALDSGEEKKLWDYFMEHHETNMIHDTILVSGRTAIYYKPILTAMPSCLQCHGMPEEMDPATYRKIKELYPKDKATGYDMNELRGLWKISFPLEG